MVDCSVSNQYSYYCDFFCLGTALRLCDCHRHVWVRYIYTTKITVWCMSSLLLYIDIQWFCYFIMFYFRLSQNISFLTNIESVHLFYFRTQHFLQQTKQSTNLIFWSLTPSTATKFMLSNQVTTERRGQGSADSCEGDRDSDLNFLASEILGNIIL